MSDHSAAPQVSAAIAAARAGLDALLQAGSPADARAGAADALAGLLRTRVDLLAAAGDDASAAADLREAAHWLEYALAATEAGDERHLDRTLAAAGAQQDLWLALEDDAGRDAAIDHLTRLLDPLPGSDPLSAELHAEVTAVTGFMLADRFRLVSAAGLAARPAIEAARADRDGAASLLAGILPALASDPPAWQEAAAAVARLRYARYCDQWPGAAEPDQADLDAAIDLLARGAAGDMDCGDLWTLVAALGDRIDLGSSPADLDAIITWARRLIAHADADPEDIKEAAGLLAESLMRRGERSEPGSGARRTDLTEAITQYERVLAATPPADQDRIRLLALLTLACWLRVAGPSASDGDIDELVRYGRLAWRALPPGDEARAECGVYLALGVHEQMLRPGVSFDPGLAGFVIGLLEEVEPLVSDDPALHLLAEVELGHFLVSRGQETGSIADLAAAQPWLARSLADLAADDPQIPELTLTVAADMFVIASLGMAITDLDGAIELLNAVVRNPQADAARVALTRCALGLAYVQRAGFTMSGPDLATGIAELAASFELTPAGDPYRLVVAWNLGSAFLTRFQRTGDLQDRDAARYYLDVLSSAADPAPVPGGPASLELRAMRESMQGLLRLTEGLGGDAEALDDAVRHLRAAAAALPPGHPLAGRMHGDVGLALMIQAGRLGPAAVDTYQAADAELRAALELIPAGHAMRPLLVMRLGATRAGLAVAARDPARLRTAIGYLTGALGEIPPEFGGKARMVAALGAAWEMLFKLTGDQSALSSAARWLTAACEDMSERPGSPQHAQALILLARVQRARRLPARARQAGLAALRERGREVLLQSGTRRGLHAARVAAGEAYELAGWCLADRNPREAVEALERGRALVLHAATSVADVAELLTVAGHEELAAQWRDQIGRLAEQPWDLGVRGSDQAASLLVGAEPLELPDDLRARALAVLAGPAADRLIAPPPLADIGAALSATGADALVYLFGPQAGAAGCAIAVPAAGSAAEPRVLSLPGLDRDAMTRIAGYGARLAAAMAPRSRSAGERPSGENPARQDPSARREQEVAVREWQAALGSLCEWAWPAVMAPLLDLARGLAPARLPRLVLVPIGLLSLVPWHAARHRPDQAGMPAYACAEAVVSYAASGRQLVDVVRRPARDVAADPVIVGNPTLDLTYAGFEAQAIRDSLYPAGRYLGFASPRRGRPADGAGSAEEVLAQLPTASAPGASLLHLACHAVAARSFPGESHLVLARGQKLMLDTVLRHASGRPAAAAGGLISLGACGSDLAVADSDESLTLATAFLAAGAATVVGARWELPDGPSALLMFMFHYFLSTAAGSPRDALRQAQLWMMDPHRVTPPEMPPHLADEAASPELAEPVAWAAVTHQGH